MFSFFFGGVILFPPVRFGYRVSIFISPVLGISIQPDERIVYIYFSFSRLQVSRRRSAPDAARRSWCWSAEAAGGLRSAATSRVFATIVRVLLTTTRKKIPMAAAMFPSAAAMWTSTTTKTNNSTDIKKITTYTHKKKKRNLHVNHLLIFHFIHILKTDLPVAVRYLFFFFIELQM